MPWMNKYSWDGWIFQETKSETKSKFGAELELQ